MWLAMWMINDNNTAQPIDQTWFQRRSKTICNDKVIMLYFKLHVQGHPEGQWPGLGWLHLGSSSGWWATTVATYCLSRMVEHSKSNKDQPHPAPRSSRSPSTSVATHTISVEIYSVHDIFIKLILWKYVWIIVQMSFAATFHLQWHSTYRQVTNEWFISELPLLSVTTWLQWHFGLVLSLT